MRGSIDLKTLVSALAMLLVGAVSWWALEVYGQQKEHAKDISELKMNVQRLTDVVEQQQGQAAKQDETQRKVVDILDRLERQGREPEEDER